MHSRNAPLRRQREDRTVLRDRLTLAEYCVPIRLHEWQLRRGVFSRSPAMQRVAATTLYGSRNVGRGRLAVLRAMRKRSMHGRLQERLDPMHLEPQRADVQQRAVELHHELRLRLRAEPVRWGMRAR